MKEIIKFYAEWCGPCRMYNPIWDEFKRENEGKASFIEVDIDKDTTGLAAKFKVRNIPSTVVVESNGDFKKEVGLLNYSKLKELTNL